MWGAFPEHPISWRVFLVLLVAPARFPLPACLRALSPSPSLLLSAGTMSPHAKPFLQDVELGVGDQAANCVVSRTLRRPFCRYAAGQVLPLVLTFPVPASAVGEL